MKALALITLAVAAFAASLAPAPATAEHQPRQLRDVKRIVTLGDSITQGGGRPGGYVWLMDQYLQVLYPRQKIEIVNAGISGHKSNDMLARFQRDVLDKKPDLVTISVGINDVWHGFTPEHPAGYGPRRVKLEDYISNVDAMLQAARKAGVDVVMFTTTTFEDQPESIRNLRVSHYNQALRNLAAKYGYRVADQNAAFHAAWAKNPSARLTTDQVHLNGPGNELMARTALLALGVPEAKLDSAREKVMQKLPR